MRVRNFYKVFLPISMFVGVPLTTLGQTSTSAKNTTCVVKRAGIQFSCPQGWRVVEDNDRGTTIGDFDQPNSAGNLTIPKGRAAIAVHPMPQVYKTFKDWIFATTKIVPDAVQTNETISNETLGTINAVCFSSPDSQGGLVYTSYFFETNGTPVNVELNYQRSSPRASEYRSIIAKIIQKASTSR